MSQVSRARASCAAGLALALAFAAACGTEVRLGDEPVDAAVARDAEPSDAEPSDVSAAPQDATPRDASAADASAPPDAQLVRLSFVDTTTVSCIDSLARQEALFASLSPTDLGFMSGTASLIRDRGALIAEGSAIYASFGVGSIRLVEDAFPDQPPGVYWGMVPDNAPGPRSTVRRSRVLAIDTNPGQDYGVAGAELETQDGSGVCFVAFPAYTGPP